MFKIEIDKSQPQRFMRKDKPICPCDCICNKPLMICLRPGQFIKCPAHPWSVFKALDVCW